MNLQIQRVTPSFKRAARIGVLSVVFLAPSVFADTVNMVMTTKISDLGPVMGGVYTSPYRATVDGTPTTVICDDFLADTYLGQSWEAERSTFQESDFTEASLSSLRWGGLSNTVQGYKQVAWLSLQLLNNIGNSPAQQEISFAIWEIFTPEAANKLTTNQQTAVAGRISAAAAAVAPQNTNWSGGATFSFYTPLSGNSPQEFIAVRTPESSAVAMLAFNFAAVLAVAFVLRRRLIHSAN